MQVLEILVKCTILIGVFLWWIATSLVSGAIFLWDCLKAYIPVLINQAKKAFSRVKPLASQLKNTLFQAISWLAQRKSKIQPGVPNPLKKRVISKLSMSGLIVSGIILFFLLFPDMVMSVLPWDSEPVVSAVDESALGGKFADGNLYSEINLPEKSEYLPLGNWVVIPKLGVRTQINEATTEDHEDALRKGVWRVPEFADPTQGAKFPTILVAHKYGYLTWSNKFRRENSFYNLDKLAVGDTFDVIWDQRRFTYEVYAGDKGKEISDYSADMILYTCEHLNSPIRIFRYARRVEY
jgi:sortase (surface protein transpeptidase)